MLSVRPYVPADAEAWDSVVERSRNGNLLHRRGYMDYHADRFTDASLVVEKGGRMVAILPANVDGEQVNSHGGLSYAGLISTPALRIEATLAVFEQIRDHYYRTLGAARLLYKAVPHIFHTYPAEEDLYALHRLGAKLIRRDLNSAVALGSGVSLTAERRRGVAKARQVDIRIEASANPAEFHALLTRVLARHGATPTHSLAELRLLMARFPAQIVLYEARGGEDLLAGAVVYDFGPAVHTQYLAVSE